MIEYYEAHDMDCPIYTTEKGFMYYFDDALHLEEEDSVLILYDKKLRHHIVKAEDIKGCVFVMNVNVKDSRENEWLKNVLNKCEEIEVFHSNGYEFGYIYRCG